MREILGLFLILLVASCSSTDSRLNAIIGTDKGHFQGISIGNKYQKVSKRVAATSVSTEEGLIACEYEIDDVSVAVRYEFDGKELYSIQADLFFPDSNSLKSFETLLSEYYNKSYGEMTESGGFFVWQEKNRVEFTLADESIEFGQPKLSLTIYNFGY
jgi:hypothetical protein